VAACADSDDNSITQHVRSFPTSEEERRNIEGALVSFRAMRGEGVDVLKRLDGQAARASRFSFVVPRNSDKVADFADEGTDAP
jgi:hypothetical protein